MDEEDDDSDNGQEEEDESDPDRDEIDRRVAQMIEDRNRQNQLHNSSSQMLRLLSHFLPGVPPNAQVVELEGVTDESGTSSSSTTSSSPTSDENTETPTCVIWAEPIMSCQLPTSGPVRCDDVRRLPPGVKPDDVKKYQSSRGLGSSVAAADTESHQPSMRSTSQSERKNNNYSVLTQTTNTNIPQSTSLNSRQTNSNAPLDNSCSGYGSSGGGPVASDVGISSFGATHNDLNDAMMRITEAANTIRMAREMLSSLNLNRQLNNSNPDTGSGENDGKNAEHAKPQNSSREDMDTRAESLPRSQESVAGSRRAHDEQSPSGSSTTKTENLFPEPILVKELPDSDSDQKDGDSKAAVDKDSKGDGKCLSSTQSTESEDSGISRSTIATLPNSDNGRTQQTLVRNSENFSRRLFDPNRMSWSSNLTRAAYQAARIARFPRIYGPVFRRAAASSTYNSLNRNQQSTTLASNIQSRHIPTLSAEVTQSRGTDNPVMNPARTLPEVSTETSHNSLNDSPRPLSSSRGAGNQRSRSRFSGGESQRMRRSLGDLKFDIDTVPVAPTGDGVRLKKPVTLDDVKKALDMVITNLKKTDAWALNMTNVNDESCALSKSNANAFALSQTQAMNTKTQQSDSSVDKSNIQRRNEPITRVEKVQIGQSKCPVIEQKSRRISNEQDNETNEGDENSGSAGTLNLRVARLQFDSENSKSASVGSASSSSSVRQNKSKVILAKKLSDRNSLDHTRKLSPAPSGEPCGILMHDKQTASASGVFSGREGCKSQVKRKKVEFAAGEESQTEEGDDDNTITDDLTRAEKDLLNDFSSPQSKPIKMTASELVISTLTQTIGDVDYLAPREYASEINLESQSQSLATQSEYMYGMSDYSFRDDSFRSPRVKFKTGTDIKNIEGETTLLQNADANSNVCSEYQDKSGNTSYNEEECESSEETKTRDTYLGDGPGTYAAKHKEIVSAHSLPQAVTSSDTEKAETSEAISDKDPNISNSTKSDNKSEHLPTSNEQCELSDGPSDDTTSQDDSDEECVSMRSISVGTSWSVSSNPFGRRVKRMFLTVRNPRPPRNTFLRKSLDVEQKPLTALQEDTEHPTVESRTSDREARPVSENVTRKESRSTVNIPDQVSDGNEISKQEVISITQSTEQLPCGVQISDEKIKQAHETISVPTSDSDLSEKDISHKKIGIAYETVKLPASENDSSEKETGKDIKIVYETIELPISENDTSETGISDKEMSIAYETIELPPSENEISEKEILGKDMKMAYETIELPASENDVSERGISDEEIKVAYETIAILPCENEILQKKMIPTTEMVQQLQFGNGISNKDNKTTVSSLEKPQNERPENDKISAYEEVDLASGDNKIFDREIKSIGEHELSPGDGQPFNQDTKTFVVETVDFDRPWRVEFFEKSPGERKASGKSTQSIPDDENSLKTIRLSDDSNSDTFPFNEEDIEQLNGACAKEQQAFDSNDVPPEGYGTFFFGTDNTVNFRELRPHLKDVLSTAVGVESTTEAAAREAKTQRQQEEATVVVELKRTSSNSPLGQEDFNRTAQPASSTSSVLTETSVAANQRGRWRFRTVRFRRLFRCCFRRR